MSAAPKLPSKVNKAMQMQEKGSAIKIVSEEHLLELLDTACECCDTEKKIDNMNLFDDYCLDEDINLEERIKSFTEETIVESGCVERELEIIDLKTKVKDAIVTKGYSLKAYKNVWFRLMSNMKNVYRVELNNSHRLFNNLCESTEYEFKRTKDDFVRVDVIKDVESLFNLLSFIKEDLKRVYVYLCENEPVEGFGCCGDYMKCSDAKKCIKKDIKFAKGCAYRRNLLEGKIFYGKNRNV